MALHLISTRALVARSSMSPGGIAGAVVGSIVGVFLISLVLGFVYFRYRRRARRLEESDLTKPPEAERRLSFPGPDQAASSQQTSQSQYYSTYTGDGQISQGGPAAHDRAAFQQYPISTNEPNFAGAPDNFAPPQQQNFGQNFDFQSYPPPWPKDAQDGVVSDQYAAAPVMDVGGGAASYYDTNIAMDSEPEQAPVPPTRQMTELYEEQLRRARASRKNSKGSTWSRLTDRFIKRKRSTRLSEITMEEGQPQPSLSHGSQDVPMPSVERSNDRAPGQPRGYPPDMQLFDEPQEMSDGSRTDLHASKKAKRHGPASDANGDLPHRLDSMPMGSPLDPQLPSAVFRQKQGPGDTTAARQMTRFKSPELPEPMEIETADYISEGSPTMIRGSHSPPLEPPQGFADPKDLMKPTNPAEKAAFNDAELIRIASASPPTSPPNTYSPPPMAPSQEGQTNPEDDEDEADKSELEEEEEEEEEPSESHFDAGIPDITEPSYNRPSFDGPSDWSTPAGQTSTNPSSGRTPDTRITPSPSPAPFSNGVPLNDGMLRPDNSLSPANSAGSPKLALTCEECGRTFDQIHKLNHHKRYHDRKHVCPYDDCGKKFGTKTHLDRHINDKHEKKKGFHCTQEGCQYFKGGKAFPRKDNWRRHMQNKHGIVPTFEPEAAE
ncbi:hypothetical protein JX265_000566 [Neoarthrinium moseri]|uniref:C2H2 type master regulator of conidiophore development brlA n=1 Tax=Neoarthrinium moseri TaxID=1658444 RepID=A0A9P9WZC7_9PEZI|nr:hypothetical protein JX265_000566 [Neoarthrinium moseri]